MGQACLLTPLRRQEPPTSSIAGDDRIGGRGNGRAFYRFSTQPNDTAHYEAGTLWAQKMENL
jgi:hypothetical protein